MGRHKINNYHHRNASGAYDAMFGASGTIGAGKVPLGNSSGNVVWTNLNAAPGATDYWHVVTDATYGAAGNGVADDTAEIQAALDAANAAATGTPRVVYIPDGTYLISSALKIYSSTYLYLAPNARIKRNANIDNMLRNGTEGVNAYAGNHNIVIDGGLWDANRTGFPTSCCVLAFGHCANVTIKNARFASTFDWHYIEFNAVQCGQVLHCEFLDMDDDGGASEAIQLDLAKGSAQFPWFGNYDDTPCDDILIQGCWFHATLSRGIGSHSATTNKRHTNIRIIGNSFDDCQYAAIYGMNWQDVTIEGNTINDCGWGVHLTTDDATALSGVTITGNVIRNMNQDAPNDRGIWVQGQDGSIVSGVSIADNTIDTCTRHGIAMDYVQGASITGNTVLNVGTDASDIGSGIIAGNCTRLAITGNNVSEAIIAGIHITNSTTRSTIANNTVQDGGGHGILVFTDCDYATVTGNNITSSNDGGAGAGSGHGISIAACDFATVTGNTVTLCKEHGIRLVQATNCVVTGNLVAENGQRTDATYDGIFVDDAADTNLIQGNTVRMISADKRHRYAIRVDDSTCNDNIVTQNDTRNGAITGQLFDAGANTLRSPHGQTGPVVLYDSGPLSASTTTIDTGASGLTTGYNILEVWIRARTDQAATVNSGVGIRFNADSGSNYDRQFSRGINTTNSAGVGSGAVQLSMIAPGAGSTASTFGVLRMTVPFYTDTLGFKGVEITDGFAETTSANNLVNVQTGQWRSQAAITRIQYFVTGAYSLVTGSRMIIYGR